MFVLSVLTFLAGAFICIAGLYAFIELIIRAYNSGSKLPVRGTLIRITNDYSKRL